MGCIQIPQSASQPHFLLLLQNLNSVWCRSVSRAQAPQRIAELDPDCSFLARSPFASFTYVHISRLTITMHFSLAAITSLLFAVAPALAYVVTPGGPQMATSCTGLCLRDLADLEARHQ